MKRLIIVMLLVMTTLSPSVCFGVDITFDANNKWTKDFDSCVDWSGPQTGGVVCTDLNRWADYGFTEETIRYEDEINSTAGYTGKGFRFYVNGRGAETQAPLTGRQSITFPTPGTEFWFRFYVRFEEDFQFFEADTDGLKFLYFQKENFANLMHVDLSQGTQWGHGLWGSSTFRGWTEFFGDGSGGQPSNGAWQVFQVHVKSESVTVAPFDGVFQIWIGEDLIIDDQGVDTGVVSQGDLIKGIQLNVNIKGLPDFGAKFIDMDEFVIINDPSSSELSIDPISGEKYIAPLPDPTAPALTCQADDSTAATSYAITATYTLDGVRTVASCTWSNSLGGSGTLTATGGNITGTISGLSSGANVITITLTDSAAEVGVCDTTITQTTPTTSVGTMNGIGNGNFR